MRLSETEKSAICKQVRRFDPDAIIFLFGSRTKDTAKGGDIDLLVQSSKLNFLQKIEILASLKAEIGEQKIDLILSKHGLSDDDPFIQSIAKEAIQL